MDCDKFFDEFKLFSELVHELSTFDPTHLIFHILLK